MLKTLINFPLNERLEAPDFYENTVTKTEGSKKQKRHSSIQLLKRCMNEIQ